MSFVQALHDRGFSKTLQLPLTANTDRQEIVRMAEKIEHVADAALVPDNRFAHVHASSASVCALLINQGFAPIMELGCRHRNRVALISDLLGARMLGVESVMLVRGKKAPKEFLSQTKYVVDTNVSELIGIAKKINTDESLPTAAPLLIGSTVTAHDPVAHWSPERLTNKISQGTQFVATQVCLDIALLERYMAHLIQNNLLQKVNVIVSAATFTSHEALADMIQEQSHLIVSEAVVKRLKQASDPERESVTICAEFLQAAKEIPGISGVQLVGDNLDQNLEALRLANL